MAQRSTKITQGNGIAERAVQQLMIIAKIQLVKRGRDEGYWTFSVADAASKTSRMPHRHHHHQYLSGETPCKRLSGNPCNYDRIPMWGTVCSVHSHVQQQGGGDKFRLPYTKRGVLVGYGSLLYIWLT